MAGFAVPVIEGAGALLLRALGFGAAAAGGAVIVDAERKRRAEAADNAKAMPISQAGTQTKSKPCDKCPPDAGTFYQRNFPIRKDWVDYQARIGGMPNGPTFIMEWNFNGVKFDGFVSGQCLLKEAKGGYDRFFDEWGVPLEWWAYNVTEMLDEVRRQSLAAIPRPPVRLEWFWQEPVSYRYFSKVLGPASPDVPHHYFP